MAIRTILTRGFGNSTFNGTVGLVVTRGYLGVGALQAELDALQAELDALRAELDALGAPRPKTFVT